MADVYHNEDKLDVFVRLNEKRIPSTGLTIFTDNYQAFNFAAMVGVSCHNKLDGHEITSKIKQIPQRVIQGKPVEAFVYALALHESETPDIFRIERENECWKIYESYADLGFAEIQKWLRNADANGDHDGVDEILNRMKVQAAKVLEISKEKSEKKSDSRPAENFRII